jgi:hypothetical protein
MVSTGEAGRPKMSQESPRPAVLVDLGNLRDTVASSVQQAPLPACGWEDLTTSPPASPMWPRPPAAPKMFASTWGKHYPGTVACVADDFELLTAHLHHPRGTLGPDPART